MKRVIFGLSYEGIPTVTLVTDLYASLHLTPPIPRQRKVGFMALGSRLNHAHQMHIAAM